MTAERRERSLRGRSGSSSYARRAGDPRSAATTHTGQALVFDMQRSRLLAAALGAVAEHGWEGASVERITGRAGVSRRTFYDLFKDREDCLIAVLESAVGQLTRELAAAEVADLPWRERVRGGLWVILCLFDRDPALARVCIVESRRGGPAVLLYRQRIVDSLAKIVDQGGDGSGADDASTLTAQGVIGGVSEVLYSLLLKAWGEPLRALLGELMSMIVLPYMGPAAARREQARAVPAFQSTGQLNGKTAVGDGGAPLATLPMRMTYRTARVLQALAEHPGQSNRQVGEMVDITDQGQTSKLLARLERLGLLVNSEPTQGERNRWELTPAGSRVTRSIESYAQQETGHVAGGEVEHAF